MEVLLDNLVGRDDHGRLLRIARHNRDFSSDGHAAKLEAARTDRCGGCKSVQAPEVSLRIHLNAPKLGTVLLDALDDGNDSAPSRSMHRPCTLRRRRKSVLEQLDQRWNF